MIIFLTVFIWMFVGLIIGLLAEYLESKQRCEPTKFTIEKFLIYIAFGPSLLIITYSLYKDIAIFTFKGKNK